MDNIKLREFKLDCMPLLHEMLDSNSYVGVCDITYKTLPKIGFVAMLGSQPVAAGFLRRVEGGFAQMDTLTSNSAFGGMIRHEGIKLIVNELLESAKQLKLKGIIAFTSDEGIMSRAKSIGFHQVDQKLIAIKIS